MKKAHQYKSGDLVALRGCTLPRDLILMGHVTEVKKNYLVVAVDRKDALGGDSKWQLDGTNTYPKRKGYEIPYLQPWTPEIETAYMEQNQRAFVSRFDTTKLSRGQISKLYALLKSFPKET